MRRKSQFSYKLWGKVPSSKWRSPSLRQSPEPGANDLDVHFRADNGRARLRQPNLGLKEFTLQP